MLYMACLKEHGSTSTPCRALSREYLDCRMQRFVTRCLPLIRGRTTGYDRGLMERDDWKNLGLANVPEASYSHKSKENQPSSKDDPK